MRRKYDHKAKPATEGKADNDLQGRLCEECYRPIHVRWSNQGLIWVHTSFR